MKLLLPLLFLVSCSSTMTMKSEKSQYAPKGYQSMGQVKYSNNGADWIISKRKEDAFKKMHEACDGEYEILNEGAQVSGRTMSSSSWGVNSYASSQDVVIDFKCLAK